MRRSNSQLKTEAQEIQEQANNVERVIGMIFLAALLLTVIEFILAFNLDAWQMFSAAWTLVVFDLFVIMSWVLVRRGRPHLGLWVIFFAMAIIWAVSTAFFLANIGFVLGLSLLLVIPLMAIQTMKPGQIFRATVFSMIAALLSFLAEIFGTENRLIVPALETVLPIATIFMGVAYAVFVFRQFPRYSIRTKFIVSAVALVTMTVISLTFIISQNTQETIIESTGERLSSVANSQGLIIGELLARQVGLMQSLSLNQTVQVDIQSTNDSYEDDPDQIHETHVDLESQWQAADFTDPLVQSRLNNPVARELLEFQGRFRTNISMMAIDQYGGLVGSTVYVDHYHYINEDWWKAAYNNGRGATYIGTPEIDQATDRFQVVIAVPIYGVNSQRVVGVLQSLYSLRDLTDILFSAQQELGGSTDYDLLIPPNRLVDVDEQQVEDLLSIETLDLLEENRDEVYSQFEFEESFRVLSQEKVNTLLQVPDIDALNWYVITHQPVNDSLAPVREQQRTFFIFGILVLLVASGGAALAGQNLARPIVNLTDAAVRVSEGDLMVQARIETEDELGTLAAAFNDMTARLRQTIALQEQRISERTRALEVSAEVSRQLSTILDEQELVREMVKQIQSAFNYYHAHIYLFDDAGENLVMVGGTGEPGRKMLESGHKIPRERGLVGRAARLRATILVPDVTQDEDWLPNELLPETVTEVAVPILVGDEVLGVLDVQHNVRSLIGQEDADLLQSIANQVAIALQNARAYRRAQQQAQREALINEIGQKIQSTTSIEKAMQTAVRELGQALAAEKTVVRLKNGSGNGQNPAHNQDQQAQSQTD